jgi:hypothetical protein
MFLLEARLSIYEQAADFSVDSTELRREDVVERIVVEARKTFGWTSTVI